VRPSRPFSCCALGPRKPDPVLLARRQVLDLLGEEVECTRYSQWVLHPPGLQPFPVVADREAYTAAIAKAAGPEVGVLPMGLCAQCLQALSCRA
jgi:hypothetical protein